MAEPLTQFIETSRHGWLPKPVPRPNLVMRAGFAKIVEKAEACYVVQNRNRYESLSNWKRRKKTGREDGIRIYQR